MKYSTYAELDVVVEGDWNPGSKGVNNPMQGIYEPEDPACIENPSVWILNGTDRVLMPESHPLWKGLVEEAEKGRLEDLENQHYERAEHEYDRRRGA